MSTSTRKPCTKATYGRVVVCMAEHLQAATQRSTRGSRVSKIAHAPGPEGKGRSRTCKQSLLPSAHDPDARGAEEQRRQETQSRSAI